MRSCAPLAEVTLHRIASRSAATKTVSASEKTVSERREIFKSMLKIKISVGFSYIRDSHSFLPVYGVRASPATHGRDKIKILTRKRGATTRGDSNNETIKCFPPNGTMVFAVSQCIGCSRPTERGHERATFKRSTTRPTKRARKRKKPVSYRDFGSTVEIR